MKGKEFTNSYLQIQHACSLFNYMKQNSTREYKRKTTKCEPNQIREKVGIATNNNLFVLVKNLIKIVLV